MSSTQRTRWQGEWSWAGESRWEDNYSWSGGEAPKGGCSWTAQAPRTHDWTVSTASKWDREAASSATHWVDDGGKVRESLPQPSPKVIPFTRIPRINAPLPMAPMPVVASNATISEAVEVIFEEAAGE